MGEVYGWHKQPYNPNNPSEKFHWKSVDTIMGIKVLVNTEKSNGPLPRYSDKPNTAYLHINGRGKINQLRVYRGRTPWYDIDWGHSHGGIQTDVAHIHWWTKSDTNPHGYDRSGDGAYLSEKLIKKYRDLLRSINKSIKFHNQ